MRRLILRTVLDSRYEKRITLLEGERLKGRVELIVWDKDSGRVYVTLRRIEGRGLIRERTVKVYAMELSDELPEGEVDFTCTEGGRYLLRIDAKDATYRAEIWVEEEDETRPI